MWRRAVICVLATCLASSVRAEELAVCEQPHEVSRSQLLRRLSLDVRGRVPSIEEYEALDQPGSSPYDQVSTWVRSDDFRRTMRRYHEEMLWPNVTSTKLAGGTNRLEQFARSPAFHLTESYRLYVWRGSSDAVCDDYEETRFLPESDPSRPRYRVDRSKIPVGSNGVRREGWRWVRPYWDPSTKIKVCAFDAQETPTVVRNGVTIECGANAAFEDPSCGCGADLRWCYGPWEQTGRAVLEDMREQLGRHVDEVTTGGRPYTDLLLSTKTWQNGRVAFYKRWLATNINYEGGAYNVADPNEVIPAKAFLDPEWTQVDRGPMHAGVLTLPSYLLRFMTNRGRANHFRVNFLCERFIPLTGVSDTKGCDNLNTDLQQRCSCRFCHSILEPMAAHFAPFSEGGTTLQRDNPTFPVQNPKCTPVAGKQPSMFCGRFYVTELDAHNPGTLISHQFADRYDSIRLAIEGGPRALAQKSIDSGEFARCAVKRLFFQFLRREMRLSGDESDEVELLEQLATGFQASNYDFPWLVQQVVSLPAYARVR